MKRIGMGIVGAGFVGPHHIDAVRRLGFVDVVAIAGSSEESARRKADALSIPRAYGSYEALIDDPDVQVVHNATPNHMHFPVNMAAIERRKHIVSDKPLARNSDEARRLLEAAKKAGILHAVTFNYRGNPLIQQARLLVSRGDIGKPHFIHGFYLQDFLIKATDYSWRLDPQMAGPTSAIGDIGSHWCDLVQHVTGLRIESVLADTTTVVPRRLKPRASREAFAVGGPPDEYDEVEVTVEDLASVLVRFEHGAKGVFSVGQVCAGHKNDLMIEVCGNTGSIQWYQERQNELWIGRRESGNRQLVKDPAWLDPEVRHYAHLPGGHQEAWADAFFNIVRDVYTAIAEDRIDQPLPPAVATFEDGYRSNCVVDAILESAANGGTWTKVKY